MPLGNKAVHHLDGKCCFYLEFDNYESQVPNVPSALSQIVSHRPQQEAILMSALSQTNSLKLLLHHPVPSSQSASFQMDNLTPRPIISHPILDILL
jgi:hypothetical protein